MTLSICVTSVYNLEMVTFGSRLKYRGLRKVSVSIMHCLK
jgi:hypothetical protein